MRQTSRLALVGIAIGILLSIGLGRLIEAGLAGSSSSDGRIIAAFGMLLAISSLAAGYLPAHRASGIDPIAALRSE